MGAIVMRPGSLDKLMAKVEKAVDGCWNFIGHCNKGGYGRIYVGTKSPNGRYRKEQAHRVAYTLLVGPIPEGLHLDHLCRNPSCVNPAHLEAVTQRTNLMRGMGPSALHAKVTHCPNGHPYSGGNLYVTPNTGSRQCVACRKQRNLAKRQNFRTLNTSR